MSRKEIVENFLNDITSTELNTYIKNHKLFDKNKYAMLEEIKFHSKKRHIDNVYQKIGNELNGAIENYYKLGQAMIVGVLLNEFYNERFNIADVKLFINEMLKNDETLKEYVYEYMKDLK